VNNRLTDRILDLIYPFRASAGAPHLLVGVGGRQSEDVFGEAYLVG
jgi:hypothetical protein